MEIKNKCILAWKVYWGVNGNLHTSVGSSPREHLGAPQNSTLNPSLLTQAQGRRWLGRLSPLLPVETVDFAIYPLWWCWSQGFAHLPGTQVERAQISSMTHEFTLPLTCVIPDQVGSTTCEIPQYDPAPALRPRQSNLLISILKLIAQFQCGRWQVWVTMTQLQLPLFLCPISQVPELRVDGRPESTTRAPGGTWLLRPTRRQ